jgi:dihydroneopterin aldolase
MHALRQRALAHAAHAAAAAARRGAAAAAGPQPPPDRILIRGLVCFGRHGVYAAERELGQRFVVDADLEVELAPAGRSDDVADTVDYAAVCAELRAEVEGPPRATLEAVAERLAAGVLARHARVAAVRVALHKPHAAVGSVVGSLGVEIVRRR